MPNQRHPDKKLIGLWADKRLRTQLDKETKQSSCSSRSELVEQLIREALVARGVKVPKVKI